MDHKKKNHGKRKKKHRNRHNQSSSSQDPFNPPEQAESPRNQAGEAGYNEEPVRKSRSNKSRSSKKSINFDDLKRRGSRHGRQVNVSMDKRTNNFDLDSSAMRLNRGDISMNVD